MDFEKEYILDEQEDFDTKEITPIKSLRSDPPPQYFTNIDGKYCKDVAGREELDELKVLVDDVPWRPLEDGYSNFWFELTNDTLSPWLNFSAKTENAVIDWGDGSGEVALTTLTPTHTYSKAGRYVVKVKGVTGIGVLRDYDKPKYFDCLKYAELNTEISSINSNNFSYCLGLKKVAHNVSTISSYAFFTCVDLEEIDLKDVTTLVQHAFNGAAKLSNLSLNSNLQSIPLSSFYGCKSLDKITIPQTVTEIGNSAFAQCTCLKEVHVQATTPPTLGTGVFTSLPLNYVIYVPVGAGDTYKAASGWSTYADHILEEGQVRNRAMLTKFNDEPEDDTPEETR